jgi:hypothetical protein
MAASARQARPAKREGIDRAARRLAAAHPLRRHRLRPTFNSPPAA